MCSLDVGGVGLEGVGLGAQLHELHPPSLAQSPAPMHRATGKQRSGRTLQCGAAAKERSPVGEGGLNAAIKGGGAVGLGWEEVGSQGRRRAGPQEGGGGGQ